MYVSEQNEKAMSSPSPENDKEKDDAKAFQQLELNFSSVIQDIVGDRSYVKFKIEYEKLQKALITSYEHNKLLVDRCNELNQDILNNTKKIESIISMSQTDQKTVASLRTEFEKAWKIVELFKEKEDQTREIITRLQDEVLNLSSLIKEGGEMSIEQENTVHVLTAEVESARGEVKMLDVQLNELRTVVDGVNKDYSNLVSENKLLLREIAESEDGIEEARKHIKEIECIISNTKNEILDLTNEIEGRGFSAENYEEIFGQKKESINEQKRRIGLLLRNYSSYEDEKNRIQLNIRMLNGTLSIKKRATEKNCQKFEELKKAVERKEFESKELPSEICFLDKEYKNLEFELNNVKEHHRAIINEKCETEKQMNKLNHDIDLIKSRVSQQELGVKLKQIECDKVEKDINVVKLEIDSEVKELVTVDIQEESIRRDITKELSDITKRNKTCEVYITKTNIFSDETKRVIMNMQQFIIKKIENRYKNDILNVDLTNIQKNTVKFQKVLEQVRKERDDAGKDLIAENKITEALMSEYSAVRELVQRLKEDIRRKDIEITTFHLRSLMLKKEVERLTNERDKLKMKCREMTKRIDLIKNEVAKRVYIAQEAEIDKSATRLIIKNSLASCRVIRSQIYKKRDVSNAIKSQEHTIREILSKYSYGYDKKVEENEELVFKLKIALSRQEELKRKVRYMKNLKIEIVRLEKELVSAQCKVLVLEDEFNKPMRVRKWFFLEHTNPELYELYIMRRLVLDQIADKRIIHQKLRVKKAKLLEGLEYIESKFQKCFGKDYVGDILFLEKKLNKKDKELKRITKKFRSSSKKVIIRKEELKDKKEEIREEKNDLHQIKGKNLNMRISIQAIENITNPKPGRYITDNFFVGGGFSVGQITRIPVASPPYYVTKVHSEGTPSVLLHSGRQLPQTLSKINNQPNSARTPKRKKLEESYSSKLHDKSSRRKINLFEDEEPKKVQAPKTARTSKRRRFNLNPS